MRALVLGIAAVALAACQTTPPNPTTFNFDRPADVDLLCLNVLVDGNGNIVPTATPEPLPLSDSRCNLNAGSTPMNGHEARIFAVVTQSDRGELAVVDLDLLFNTGIVDNEPLIPGFTFIPVGQFPGAVSVDPRGIATYVANTASSYISVLDNRTLLRGGAHSVDASNGMPDITLMAPAHDVSVQTTSDGHTVLYATVPQAGALAVVNIDNPSAPSAVTYVPLDETAPGGDGGIDGGTMDGATIDGAAGDAAMVGTPQPEALAVATDDNGNVQTIYVSDQGEPLIHVVHADLSVGTPLQPGVPTRTIVVTPPTLDYSNPTANPPVGPRFVYASTSIDGSLLVMNANTGELLMVNAIADQPACQAHDLVHCQRIDPHTSFFRVPLVAPVRSLTVVTRDAVQPTYDNPAAFCHRRMPLPTPSLDPLAQCDVEVTGEDPSSVTLRGVQVAVGLRTGQMQVVDVEDWQFHCTNRIVSPEGQTPQPFQQHTPRAATALVTPVGSVSSPILSINGGTVNVTSDQPQIVPIDPMTLGCSSATNCCTAATNYCIELPQIGGRPGNGVEALAVREETWSVTYEAVLPGMSFSTSSLVPDPMTGEARVQLPEANFCTGGVLDGDWFSLTNPSPCITEPTVDAGFPSVPPDANVCDPMCQSWFGTTTAPCNRDLRITHAFQDHLQVQPIVNQTSAGWVAGDTTGCSQNPITGETPEAARDAFWQAVHRCYPEATRFDVRAAGVWIPFGSATGYVHAVTEDPTTHACVADPNAFPTGRIHEGVPYDEGPFQLEIATGQLPDPNDPSHTTPNPTARNTSYSFQITGGYTPLVLGGNVLPNALLYSCPVRRLYMVDEARNSLLEYNVAPIVTPRTFN